MISASLVKELREKTGAGMLDCKKALEANNGDIEASVDWLREKGISKAAKKADRIAAEGLAAILIKGNKAAVVEVNSETDFVAKNEEFVALVNEILTMERHYFNMKSNNNSSFNNIVQKSNQFFITPILMMPNISNYTIGTIYLGKKDLFNGKFCEGLKVLLSKKFILNISNNNNNNIRKIRKII